MLDSTCNAHHLKNIPTAPHPTTMHWCCLPHPLDRPMHAPPSVMSSNGETNTVLRGVTHGAVDFLIKPVRLEELRNMWQHVVRRRRDLVRQQCTLYKLTAHEQGASRRDLAQKGFLRNRCLGFAIGVQATADVWTWYLMCIALDPGKSVQTK